MSISPALTVRCPADMSQLYGSRAESELLTVGWKSTDQLLTSVSGTLPSGVGGRRFNAVCKVELFVALVLAVDEDESDKPCFHRGVQGPVRRLSPVANQFFRFPLGIWFKLRQQLSALSFVNGHSIFRLLFSTLHPYNTVITP